MIMAIVQARMGSSRLSGKVLKMICNKTMLELQLERVQRASSIDMIIVATTQEAQDDSIALLCEKQGLKSYRGSENDVLDRYYQAARYYKADANDNIIRITADCPLIDPEVIDELIALFTKKKVDYASNIDPPTFPDGLDVEIFKFGVLEKAWHEARLKSEREHVTPYIRNHPELFSRVNLENNRADLSNLRWTVDEPEDFEFIKVIYEALYPVNPTFTTDDILHFLNENTCLSELNTKFSRNAGYDKSLREDEPVELPREEVVIID